MNQKSYRNIRLKHGLSVFFVLFILITIVCVAIPLFLIFQKALVENISASRSEVLSQVEENIDKLKADITTVSDLYYENEEIQNLVLNPTPQGETVFTEHSIFVKNTLQRLAFPYTVVLLCDDGRNYSMIDVPASLKDYKKQLWYYHLDVAETGLLWLNSIQLPGSGDDTSIDCFALVRRFYGNTGKEAGLLMVIVPERELYKTYSGLLENENNIYLVSSAGQVVSHSTQAMVGRWFYRMDVFYDLFGDANSATIEKSGEPYLFSRNTPGSNAWIVVEEIPMSTILAPLRILRIQTFSLIGLFLLVSLLVAKFLAARVASPLTEISCCMKQAESGDFHVEFPQKGFREIREISSSSQQFLQKIVALMEDVKTKESLKREAERRFLQMQINPHFIHNTIFCIRCMIDMDRAKQACDMLAAFDEIIKCSLETESEVVRLRDEFHLLEKYSFILQQRYGNSFHITFQLPEDCEELLMLRFILQPLIENSVFHGFSSGKENGQIVVSAVRNSNRLILQVKDNGCGMSQDVIDSVLKEGEIRHKHIGIKNVYMRLQLFYGQDVDLDIQSTPGMGNCITISLPIDDHSDNKAPDRKESHENTDC